MAENPGKIYVVATPIGNLEDITFRAVRVLKEVGLIVAEDTRVSKKLLTHFRITNPVDRFDENVSDNRVGAIVKKVLEGKNVALVTDAGTPNVSDPGWRLVSLAVKSGVEVIPVPGPSAVTALISVSHFPMSEFVFLGYPPAKKGRKKFFDEVATEPRPVIIYESPHRIVKTLSEISSRIPNQESVVAKELTKLHERVWRGSISEINQAIENLSDQERRGEWVIGLAYEKK